MFAVISDVQPRIPNFKFRTQKARDRQLSLAAILSLRLNVLILPLILRRSLTIQLKIWRDATLMLKTEATLPLFPPPSPRPEPWPPLPMAVSSQVLHH